MFGHGREVCTFGDSLSSTLFLLWSCAISLPSESAQMYLECKQCCHVFRGGLRAVKETVDDNVLALAGLPSDPLKEEHLTTKSGRRRKLCEDNEKALTSELAAKRMKSDNQLARIDGVDTKRSRKTLSKEMLAYLCAGFRTFHDLRGVFGCTEDGTCVGGACQGEDRHARWYETCIGVADPGLWKSKHREPSSCPQNCHRIWCSFTYDSLF